MRKIAVRKKDHPHNIMLAQGHAAKKHVRKMSNAELDAFISENVKDEADREKLLALPRNRKIQCFELSARKSFVDDYNKQIEAKEVKSF